MGPNRQRRPDAGRGGRGGRGGARSHVRRFHHHLSNDPANPAAAMSSTSRDMIIDVLHHVASAGRVAVSEKHFDVTQQAVVTFHKNSSATPAAQSAFLNLFSDAKAIGFGFPSTLVAAAAESILSADPILQRTVKHWSDILANHGPLVTNLVKELFALQLWSERAEGAREQTLTALEALSDEDLDCMETSCNEEVEQLQQLFEDNIIAMDAADEDFAAGASAGDDESDDERELFLALQTQDGVSVMCCIRLPEGYPMNPPTVTFQPRKGKLPAPLEEKSLRQLSSAARKQLIQTAVATINGFEGMPCLVPLVHALVETAGNINGKVPEVQALPSAESDRARQLRDLEESGAQKKRKAFVAKLTSDARAADGSGRADAHCNNDDDDDDDRFVLPARVELATVNTAEQAKIRAPANEAAASTMRRNPRLDLELLEKWQTLSKKGSLMAVRNKLPAVACREQIRSILANHSVLVVSGETGSGKTTQVPQYLFEFMCEESRGSACNIVCTQPRRLAATSVALRVAEERDEAIGETVGYSIRLENKCSAATKILYCTTGIILRRMQTDKLLTGVSHIVVDEIHERGVDTDFLLILLKDLLQRRADLKLVLMSATMSTELFSRYFGGAPIVSIAGRTHPVQVYHLEKIIGMVHYIVEDNSPYAASSPSSHYAAAHHSRGAKSGAAPPAARNKNKKLFELAPDDGDETGVEEERDVRRLRERLVAADPSNAELAECDVSTLSRMNLDVINYELIERIVFYICTEYRFDGAILVFLPGMAEIQKCHEELRFSPEVMKRCVVYNLHSSLESKDQHAIFRKPPAGTRKVILGTNIMETSITIDDAVFVIDCGKHKENQYDARKSLSKLVTTTVSKANCRQRQGRAGRVRPGICFRLFTSAQFADFDDHQLCEMHRVPLESLVLQIYTLNLGDEMEYLSKALSPPEEKAVKASVKVLTHLGALTAEKRLTSLGQHLANLPLDVKIGKMIIHGAVMQCLDPVLTIAACYSVRSPFLASVEQQPEVEAIRRAYAAGSASDSLASWNVYRKWISIAVTGGEGANSVASKTFCRENYVSLATLLQIQAMKRQYERYLAEAGFLSVGDAKSHEKRRPGGHQHFLFEPYRTLDDMVYEAGGPHNNAHSGLSKVIVACLVAGMYPNVAKVTPRKPSLHSASAQSSSSSRRQGNMRIATFDGSEVVIHPSSVASRETQFPSPLLLYADKVQTSLTFVREITVITPLHVILFGASTSMEYKAPFGELVVDDVTAFKCAPDEAVLLKSLKDQFDSALRVKINEPSTVWETVSHTVVRAIVKLLREEGSATRGAMVVATPGQTPPLTAPKAGGDGGAARGEASAPQSGNTGAAGSAPTAATTPYYIRNKTCFNCGELGHLSRHCPNPAPPKTRGAATVRCFICGQWHHPNECPHTRSPKQRDANAASGSAA